MKSNANSILLPKVSYSWKFLYEWCPRHYKYSRVERLTPDRPKNPSTIMGNAVHRVVELMYKKKRFSLDYVRGAWSYVFDNTFKYEKYTFSSELNRQRWYDKGLKTLEQMYAMAEEKGLLIEPIAVEWKFSIEVKSKLGRRFIIRGKIDLIVRMGDEIWVLDLKTGSYVPTAKELDEHDQLTVYSLAVEKVLDIKDPKLGLWYPHKKKIYWTRRRTDRDYDILINEIERDQFAIERGEFEPTYNLCQMCQYQDRCKGEDAVNKTDVQQEWFYTEPKKEK